MSRPWLLALALLLNLSAHHTQDDACMRVLRAAPNTHGTRVAYVKSEHRLCPLQEGQAVWQRAASHGR